MARGVPAGATVITVAGRGAGEINLSSLTAGTGGYIVNGEAAGDAAGLQRGGGSAGRLPGELAQRDLVHRHRQVVVVGRTERVPRDEAEEYFRSRPHGSRLVHPPP